MKKSLFPLLETAECGLNNKEKYIKFVMRAIPHESL
jgi:hypothetical protein